MESLLKIKINTIDLDDYLNKGYIYKRKHPLCDLFILKYSQKTIFEQRWDNITLICRGLWINSNGDILARSFDKFFNHGELYEEEEYKERKGNKVGYIVEEKLDGSLIIVAKVDEEIIVSSSGSFESEQATKGKEFLYRLGYDKYIEKGKTYIFEIIYKNNRIVISYGDKESLTLLGIRDTNTGEYLPIDNRFETVKRIDISLEDIESEIEIKKFINKEGYVIKFNDGHIVKMKYLEYLRLHKLFTGINEKLIWEYLSEGKDIFKEVENIPDELFDFITRTKDKLEKQFKGIAIVHRVLFSDYNCEDRKEFAQRIQNLGDSSKGILFSMKSGKDYKPIIWKMIKPKIEGVVNFGEKFNG